MRHRERKWRISTVSGDERCSNLPLLILSSFNKYIIFFHFSPPSRSALLMFDGNGYKDTESTTSYLCYSYVEFGWFFFGRLIHPFNSTNVDLLTPQRIS